MKDKTVLTHEYFINTYPPLQRQEERTLSGSKIKLVFTTLNLIDLFFEEFKYIDDINHEMVKIWDDYFKRDFPVIHNKYFYNITDSVQFVRAFILAQSSFSLLYKHTLTIGQGMKQVYKLDKDGEKVKTQKKIRVLKKVPISKDMKDIFGKDIITSWYELFEGYPEQYVDEDLFGAFYSVQTARIYKLISLKYNYLLSEFKENHNPKFIYGVIDPHDLIQFVILNTFKLDRDSEFIYKYENGMLTRKFKPEEQIKPMIDVETRKRFDINEETQLVGGVASPVRRDLVRGNELVIKQPLRFHRRNIISVEEFLQGEVSELTRKLFKDELWNVVSDLLSISKDKTKHIVTLSDNYKAILSKPKLSLNEFINQQVNNYCFQKYGQDIRDNAEANLVKISPMTEGKYFIKIFQEFKNSNPGVFAMKHIDDILASISTHDLISITIKEKIISIDRSHYIDEESLRRRISEVITDAFLSVVTTQIKLQKFDTSVLDKEISKQLGLKSEECKEELEGLLLDSGFDFEDEYDTYEQNYDEALKERSRINSLNTENDNIKIIETWKSYIDVFEEKLYTSFKTKVDSYLDKGLLIILFLQKSSDGIYFYDYAKYFKEKVLSRDFKLENLLQATISHLFPELIMANIDSLDEDYVKSSISTVPIQALIEIDNETVESVEELEQQTIMEKVIANPAYIQFVDHEDRTEEMVAYAITKDKSLLRFIRGDEITAKVQEAYEGWDNPPLYSDNDESIDYGNWWKDPKTMDVNNRSPDYEEMKADRERIFQRNPSGLGPSPDYGAWKEGEDRVFDSPKYSPPDFLVNNSINSDDLADNINDDLSMEEDSVSTSIESMNVNQGFSPEIEIPYLSNTDNSCYMDSVLMILLQTNIFDKVIANDTDSEHECNGITSEQIKKILSTYKNTKRIFNIDGRDGIRSAFQKCYNDLYDERSAITKPASQFYDRLVDFINDLKMYLIKNHSDGSFGADYSSLSIEEFIQGYQTYNEVTGKILDQNIIWDHEENNAPYLVFNSTSTPPYREFDNTNDEMINDQVATKMNSFKEEMMFGSKRYRLVGVVVFYGSNSISYDEVEGHYYSYFKKGETWYKYDGLSGVKQRDLGIDAWQKTRKTSPDMYFYEEI